MKSLFSIAKLQIPKETKNSKQVKLGGQIQYQTLLAIDNRPPHGILDKCVLIYPIQT